MQYLINLYNDFIYNVQQLFQQPASRRTVFASAGIGFTIVELLIVIVVIGVLATIVVVAYNGIQTSAENTKTVQAVGQYVKAIKTYHSLKGNYPITTLYPCLGPHPGTSCGRVTAGTNCTYGATGSNVDFDAMLKEVIQNLPSLSSQRVNCGGTLYRGGFYTPSTGSTATIVYFLNGIQTCNSAGASSVAEVHDYNFTRCTLTL